MVFFLYTGMFKAFDAVVKGSLDITDQYEISIFISVQNRDFELAKKYMMEQIFLINMVNSVLGWMSNFPLIFPWWKTIIDKLMGIKMRNENILDQLQRQEDIYNWDTAPWNSHITKISDNNLPDDRWARPTWNEIRNPKRNIGGGRWQPRPQPGMANWDGNTWYPPLGPMPLPYPGPGRGKKERSETGRGGGAPPFGWDIPVPREGWDKDENPEDWWKKPNPEELGRPGSDKPPGGHKGGIDDVGEGRKPRDFEQPLAPGASPDTRRRCGY